MITNILVASFIWQLTFLTGNTFDGLIYGEYARYRDINALFALTVAVAAVLPQAALS